MIFAHDKGRMCNNILQYAHVYAWGREHGRKTMSMRFAYKYRFFKLYHTGCNYFWCYLLAKYLAKWKLIPTVNFEEKGADYTKEENQMLTCKNIVVHGWYARWYDLFLKYKDEIREQFAFKEETKRKPDMVLSGIPQNNIRLGLHIRRGDYKTWNGGCYYYTDEQYISLLNQFVNLFPDKHINIFICGNDPELDKEAYLRAFPNQTLAFPDGNPGEDLYLLSQCDYLMGAYSTFTLVASMYRDIPLYWIMNPNEPVMLESFGYFNELFKKV